MAAPTQNSNAEKWTLEKTNALLDSMEYYITTQASPLIGQAIRYAGANRNAWSYLKKKWQNNKAIMTRIDNIEEDFEYKLVQGGLTRKYHWGCVKFLLMTKYNYRIPAEEAQPAPSQPQPGAQASEETPPPPPDRKPTPKEKKIERLIAHQTERRKNDGKDFAPRDTDTPTLAQTRTRARNNPGAYSSTIPNEPYIKFSDDLFAYIG